MRCLFIGRGRLHIAAVKISHVEFEAGLYTRLNHKTPQEVATIFGKIRLWRTGYQGQAQTGTELWSRRDLVGCAYPQGYYL
jgi:hypothetical protein